MKKVLYTLVAVALAGAAGCGDENTGDNEIKVYTPRGQVTMTYTDLVVGTGETVKKGDTVDVHYTGKLTSGKKFDSSLDRGKPFRVENVGSANVIKGWNEGIPGMKVGGKRMLYIPYELAYGEEGMPPAIPPRAKLVFEVEVLKIVPPGD